TEVLQKWNKSSTGRLARRGRLRRTPRWPRGAGTGPRGDSSSPLCGGGRRQLMSVDPISFDVIRNALVAATDEMVVTLRRSAYSTNIKTRSDFSCAFFDAKLRSVAQGFA